MDDKMAQKIGFEDANDLIVKIIAGFVRNKGGEELLKSKYGVNDDATNIVNKIFTGDRKVVFNDVQKELIMKTFEDEGKSAIDTWNSQYTGGRSHKQRTRRHSRKRMRKRRSRKSRKQRRKTRKH